MPDDISPVSFSESSSFTHEALPPSEPLAVDTAVAELPLVDMLLSCEVGTEAYEGACRLATVPQLQEAISRCESAPMLADLSRQIAERLAPAKPEAVPFEFEMVKKVMGELVTVVVELGGKPVSVRLRRLNAEEYQRCLDLENAGAVPVVAAGSKHMPGSTAAEAAERFAQDQQEERKRAARRLSDAYALATGLVEPAIPAGPLEQQAKFLDDWPYSFRSGLVRMVIHHSAGEGQVVDFFTAAG